MFTRREKEILALIAKGLTSEAISEHLFISTDTVKTHRKNMIKKAKNEPSLEDKQNAESFPQFSHYILNQWNFIQFNSSGVLPGGFQSVWNLCHF